MQNLNTGVYTKYSKDSKRVAAGFKEHHICHQI